MISFNSQVTKGDYKIQFETDNYELYNRLQNVIRDMIDATKKESDCIPLMPIED